MEVTRGQLNEHIAGLAAKDPAFRAALLANPRGAMAQVLEGPLPESLTIRVVEDTPDTLHLVLPPAPAAGAELSDRQLERVAGGAQTIHLYLRRR
jgi:hypothetical protein